MALDSYAEAIHARSITATENNLLEVKAPFAGTLSKIVIERVGSTAGAPLFDIKIGGGETDQVGIAAGSSSISYTSLVGTFSVNDVITVNLISLPSGASLGTKLRIYLVMTDPSITLGGGGGGSLPTDHISGLDLRWDAVNGFSVLPGEAWVPGANKLVTLASTHSNSGSFADGKYYVYLYDSDGTGTGDIETSTTAPVFYNGNAQYKTGDNTRRFIGYLLCYGSQFIRFISQGHGNLATIKWQRGLYAAPMNLFASAQSDGSDTGVDVDLSTFSIPSMCLLHLESRAFAAANNRFFFSVGPYIGPNSSDGYWTGDFVAELDNQNGGTAIEHMQQFDVHVPNSSTTVRYTVRQNINSGGTLMLYMRGFTYRR
jgi:hypothetical protein